jgi:hypothetical protein
MTLFIVAAGTFTESVAIDTLHKPSHWLLVPTALPVQRRLPAPIEPDAGADARTDGSGIHNIEK